jgi:iron(III) transport system substrate-binding protein
MRARGSHFATLGALASVLVLVAGCGSPTGAEKPGPGADPDVAKLRERVQGLGATEREHVLTRMARAEGQLDLYTSLESELAGSLADAFEQRFGVPVKVFRGTAEEVAARALEEARANRTAGDVAEASGVVMQLLSSDGVLVPWEPVGAALLPHGARFRDWTAARTNRYVLAWNTDRVGAAERPHFWTDLADPRWHGKVVMEVSDSDFARTLIKYWVAKGASPKEANDRFAAIARNARFVDGHTLATELLGSGEFDVGAGMYGYQVDEAARRGAPVTWRPAVEPTITRPNGPGIFAGAPHPAAAALFTDWLTGAEGQRELRRLGLEPIRSDIAPNLNVESVPINLDAYLAEQEEWQARYEHFVQLGGAGPAD